LKSFNNTGKGIKNGIKKNIRSTTIMNGFIKCTLRGLSQRNSVATAGCSWWRSIHAGVDELVVPNDLNASKRKPLDF
jgi:hypothetical protein